VRVGGLILIGVFVMDGTIRAKTAVWFATAVVRTTTDAAAAKREGIEGSGKLPDFSAERIALGPDHALIRPVSHLAADRVLPSVRPLSLHAPDKPRIVCQTSY